MIPYFADFRVNPDDRLWEICPALTGLTELPNHQVLQTEELGDRRQQ